MSIRTKLLIVLVAFAIVPLLIAFGVGQLSTRLVSERLSTVAQQELVEAARARLLRSVSAASALTGSQALTIELIVSTQAAAFARALEETSTTPGRLRQVFLSRADFDERQRVPPGLVAPPIYRTASGEEREVSFEAPSVLLAPGVDARDVRSELIATSGFARVYQLLRRHNTGLILFQYVCTASGVHSAYPGHGGYPEGYEPRERSWYRLAANPDESQWAKPTGVVWGPPIVDAVTGHAVLTVSAPVVLRDGSLGGVTAVDIRVADLLGEIMGEPLWSDREEALIVSTIGSDPSVGDTSVEIFAQRSYEAEAGEGDWRRGIELEVFRLDDDVESRSLVAAIQAGQTGVARGERDGRGVLYAFSPIRVGAEESVAAVIYTVPIEEVIGLVEAIDAEFWQVTLRQLASNATVALLVLGAVAVFAFRGSRSVTEPVHRLAEAVGRVASGDLEAKAEVDRDDELGRLAKDFNHMTAGLRERVQLRQSLDLAMEVQQSLLPSRPPSLQGYDIAGQSVYCDETGGDYYDYLEVERLGPRTVGVALGDVTGHGIAAALLMTTARALLRSRMSEPGAIGEQLTDINRGLCEDNAHGRFMTLFFLLIDAERDELRWSTAGHDPAIVYDPGTNAFTELDDDEGGIPLGIHGDWVYDEGRRDAPAPGSVIVLGTDGIWEAQDPREAMFGKDRLREVMRSHAGDSAERIRDAILDAVRSFRGARQQLDDITLVVIKRTA